MKTNEKRVRDRGPSSNGKELRIGPVFRGCCCEEKTKKGLNGLKGLPEALARLFKRG